MVNEFCHGDREIERQEEIKRETGNRERQTDRKMLNCKIL